MKYSILFLGSMVFCLITMAQKKHIQHFLKVGASSEFTNFKGNSSANFVFSDSRFPRPILGYEIGLKSDIKNLKWVASVDLFTMQTGWRVKNQNFLDRSMSVGYLNGQLFLGAGYKLNPKNEKQNSNYFSLIGGVAFPFLLQKDSYKQETGSTNAYGEFVYIKDVKVETQKYYPAFNLGVRYHIRNKIGREVAILELKYNNSFNNYALSTINYSIDGIAKSEQIRARAKQLQFSIILPIGYQRKNPIF